MCTVFMALCLSLSLSLSLSLLDNGRYQTQLVQEMGSQLQRARREGEEAAERKSSGEISVLKSQLGSKSKYVQYYMVHNKHLTFAYNYINHDMLLLSTFSRTLKNLQSCLRSLK